MRKGLKWEASNGQCVRFWRDVWIEQSPLLERTVSPVAEEKLGYQALQYWEHGVGWRWSLLGQYLNNSTLVKFAVVILRPEVSLMDTFVWLDAKKNFSVKKAYKLMKNWSMEDAWEG